MKCNHCGHYNDPGASFCVECGMRLSPSIKGGERATLRTGLIAAISVALLGTVGLMAYIATQRAMGPMDTLVQPQVEVRENASGVIRTDDGTELKDATDDSPSNDDTTGIVNLGPTVRSSISEYSWDELAQIATLMRNKGTREGALGVAAQYDLVEADGRFPDTTKIVSLSDGTQFNMRLVDVMHDDTEDGGKASMTFIASNIGLRGSMSGSTTTDGGWASSQMRSWLNNELIRLFPSDVNGAIVGVSKCSNNVGKTLSGECMTQTTDRIWLPSIVELCGPVNWEFHTDPSNSGYYNWVFNQEGSQYAYFTQQYVISDAANPCLSMGEEWWMRSTAASTGRGRFVSASGDPSTFGDSNAEHGIVIGFCL